MSIYENVPDATIIAHIRQTQEIQKRNPPTSFEWKQASRTLKPLFREMQRRYPAGTVGPAV